MQKAQNTNYAFEFFNKNSKIRIENGYKILWRAIGFGFHVLQENCNVCIMIHNVLNETT
jgi:hypothetical protein